MAVIAGPLGVLVAALKKPDPKRLDKIHERGGLRNCPHCAEFIKPGAVVCRDCQRDLVVR